MKTTGRAGKLPFWALVIFLAIYFILMGLPNAIGSEDHAMIWVFEPDEASPLPYLFDMLKPADGLGNYFRNFLRYDYYFYGYPYFSYSAITLLPVLLFGKLTDQYPLVMLVLRQFVSVLPVMISAYWLVKMQTGSDRKWASVGLLAGLLLIPGVIRNNFWWHNDGITVLAVVATIYFLMKDDLKFGSNFLWAAFACGVATGIKFSGVYFVLTIATYLLWGLVSKRLNFWQMVVRGVLFIVIMAGGYILCNPLILLSGPRAQYISYFQRQSASLRGGYNVVYARGLAAAAPTIKQFYGSWVFLAAALFAPVYGIIRNRNRLLNVVILTWMLPLTLFVTLASHFKFQYWLPVALPLFSSFFVFFPDAARLRKAFADRDRTQRTWSGLASVVVILLVVQLGFFLYRDVELYRERMARVENSESLSFYDEVVPNLGELVDQNLLVYKDVRLYVPDRSPWETISTGKLLTYSYFDKHNPTIMLLMQQRLRDYLNPEVSGLDPEELETAREFYRNADEESVDGYCFAYRNEFGLAYVREDLCDLLP